MSTTRLTSGRTETAISSPTSNCGQTTQVVAKDHKKTTALVGTKKGQQAGFHESKRNTKGNLEAFVSISPCTNVDEPTRGDKIQLRRGSCREDPPPSYDVAVKSSLNATFHYPTALQAPSAVTRAPELLPKHNNTTHRNGHEWRQQVPPTSSNVPMSGSRTPLPHRKLNSYSNNLSEDLKEYVPSSTTPTVINSSSKPCIDPNVSIGATNSNQPESHMKSVYHSISLCN
ncbi:hypothetical protein BJ138DRAFT_116832 [Hygrophoropsis aurantiaca]|uniref:Uncharacterized protein n=1 Tax=Hygrophoropsis aurantiaca TaxID=72124 RepID=A0ACB8AA75_9AGAM|nr:hypothetical protein BJ138DRAFT_116832 [Hygrophoropsis aurantiaca]